MKKSYKVRRKLKECKKCGILDYHYSGSDYCWSCNNDFKKDRWN